MAHRIIGIFIIIGSCFGLCFSIWHLIDKLRIPKNRRLWWGEDIVIQMFYPMYVLGVMLGVYQFTI